MRSIEYMIPRLGLVNFNLYGESENLYDLLQYGGHIIRLKKNPQLGVISSVYEGAHHTRWEYVAVQLYILELFRRDGTGNYLNLGLTATCTICGKKFSGQEIIQCWILLLNSGHLIGTFSNERAIMSYLQSNTDLLRKFIAYLPNDKTVRKFSKSTISSQDTYRFHEVLSFFFIERLRRKNKSLVELFTEVLKYYRHNPDKNLDKITKLRSIFKRVRLFAFLYLDSQYSTLPISFDLSQLILNFNELSTGFFALEDTEISKSLLLFQDLMCENFYLSPKSMSAFFYQYNSMLGKIKKSNFASVGQIKKLLIGKNNIELEDWSSVKYTPLRLWFDTKFVSLPVFDNLKQIDLENRWNKSLQKSVCGVLIEKDFTNRLLGINFTFKTVDKNRVLNNYKTILRLIYEFKKTFSDDYKVSNEYISRIFTKQIQCLSIFLLTELWKDKYIFIEKPRCDIGYWDMLKGSSKTIKYMSNYIGTLNDRNVCDDIVAEVKCSLSAVQHYKHKSYHLVSPSSIIFKDSKTGKDFVEFDGVFIASSSTNISLVFVESKNGSYGTTAAKTDLRKKLIKLNIITDDSPDNIIKLKKGACISIAIDNIFLRSIGAI